MPGGGVVTRRKSTEQSRKDKDKEKNLAKSVKHKSTANLQTIVQEKMADDETQKNKPPPPTTPHTSTASDVTQTTPAQIASEQSIDTSAGAGANAEKNTGTMAGPVQNPWLTVRRQTYENSLTTSFKVIDESYQQLTLAQANDLLKSIETLFGRFENEHFALVCDPNQTPFVETHMEVFTIVNSQNIHARQMLAEKIAELTPQAVAPPIVQAEPKKIQVELQTPDALANITNTWGKFGGDYSQWHSFRDKWLSQIHENEKVRPVLKLQCTLWHQYMVKQPV